MEIDELILKETTRCSKDFSCLKNENDPCLTSKVSNSVNGKVIFISCIEDKCNYDMRFGYSKICNCPVRKEIFNKYNR